MKRNACFILPTLFVLFLITTVWGEPVRNQVKYTKKATLAGTVLLRFSLWTADTGEGEEVWFEEKSIKVTGSQIRTYLGDTTPLDGVDFSEQLWVQVERLRKGGTRIMIGKREMLGAVPYALWSPTPAGNGPLGVYDGGGLFLGYFTQALHVDPGNTPSYQIFNPDIPAFLIVFLSNPASLKSYFVGNQFFFTSTDCSGGQYLFFDPWSFPLQGLLDGSGSYYIYDIGSLPVSGSEIKSRRDGADCSTQSYEPSRVAFPVKQVEVPLMSTTLQHPIVVKPIQ